MKYASIKYCMLVIGVCLISVPHTFGQKAGLSATGGSLTRNRTDPPSTNWRSQPRSYRPVVRELGLDFSDLEESYWTGREQNHRLKFETVVKAKIAVDMRVADPEGSELTQLIRAVGQSHNRLPKALQETFSLTLEESKELERKVSEKYNAAARVSHF